MRVITFIEMELVEVEETVDVYLLSIYDKSKQESISEKLVEMMIKEILAELVEAKNIESPKDSVQEEE